MLKERQQAKHTNHTNKNIVDEVVPCGFFCLDYISKQYNSTFLYIYTYSCEGALSPMKFWQTG